MCPFSLKKRAAYTGFTARSTLGSPRISVTPSTASTENHTTMTGPKNRPIVVVPRCWIRKSAARIAQEIGTTQSPRPGAAIFAPSTAESTEMAGVMAASP